jgi:hypothetical protein
MRISDRAPVPPRCLGSLVATTPTEPLRALLATAFVSEEEAARALEQHLRLGRDAASHVPPHEQLAVWTLACACGGDAGKLLGVREHDLYVSPVVFGCAGCGKSTGVFDAALDGWNAEVDRKRRRRKTPASTFALRCPQCKTTSWRPAVVLAYQCQESDLGDAAPRWQDFFDAAGVGGTCVGCGAVTLPASFECA